jgi:hypothetical protein
MMDSDEARERHLGAVRGCLIAIPAGILFWIVMIALLVWWLNR